MIRKLDEEIQNIHHFCDINDFNITNVFINVLNLYRDKYVAEEQYEKIVEIDKMIDDYKKKIREYNFYT